MKALPHQKARVIALRKQGLTYSEILARVPVAQSSVSLWCRDVQLSHKQNVRIAQVRNEGIKLGASIRHNRAIALKQSIVQSAADEIKHISTRELWLIGVALYWAEGSKQSVKTVSQGIKFTNSDANMIKILTSG